MKRLIFLLICIVALTACKNTDQGPTVIGKWTLNKLRIDYFINPSLIKDSVDANITGPNYVQFNADGTGTSTVTDGSFPNGFITQQNVPLSGDFTYEISAATLTL